MNILQQCIGIATLFSNHDSINYDDEKAELRKQWRESMQLPRKAKKKRRKYLLDRWNTILMVETPVMFNF